MTTPAGVPLSERNVAQAFCWLMRAALLNQPREREKLSMMFARGERDDQGNAVRVDLVQADVWFRLAAHSHDRAANDHRPAQRGEAPGQGVAAAQG
jgi:TPR repeat protein